MPLYTAKVPLLTGAEDDPVIRATFYPEGTVAVNAQAARAKANFEQALDAVGIPILLTPGQLVIVDNYRQLHRREYFRPNYDGYDRHLKRVSVYQSFQSVRQRQGCYTRILQGRI